MSDERRCTWRVVRMPDDPDDEVMSFGSAVVVDGRWFGAALEGVSLVLTCSHVCTARPSKEPPRALPAELAGIDFCDGEHRVAPLAVRRVVWESPRGELDAALLEVEELPAWSRDAAAQLALRTAALGERVVLSGYLMNQREQLTRGAMEILAAQTPYLYYDVETGRGLSGAPLFAGGALVGLHRGDSRVLPPERALAPRHGVAIEDIVRACSREKLA